MQPYQTTPDPTAVMGRRIAAFLIDTVLVMLIIVASFARLVTQEEIPADMTGSQACTVVDQQLDTTACAHIGDRVFYVEDAEGRPLALWGPAFVVGFLNQVVLTALVGGSIGKLLVGVRVVRGSDGRGPGLGRAFARWLLLIIDAGICFLPGLITSLATKGHRRIGDLVAGTLVLRSAAAGRPPLVPGLTATQIPAPTGTTPPPAPPPHAPPPATPPPPAPGAPPTQPIPAEPPRHDPHPTDPVPPAPAPAPPAEPEPTVRPEPRSAPEAPAEPEPAPLTEAEPAPPTEAERAPEADARPAPEARTEPGHEPEPQAPEQRASAQPASGTPGVDTPMWDERRRAYLQWDPALQRWMQWDESAQVWRPIS